MATTESVDLIFVDGITTCRVRNFGVWRRFGWRRCAGGDRVAEGFRLALSDGNIYIN
jgi:hypothetical protein